jgi:hypothetical protein
MPEKCTEVATRYGRVLEIVDVIVVDEML